MYKKYNTDTSCKEIVEAYFLKKINISNVN